MRTLLLPLGVAVCLLHPAFLFADTSMGPPIAIEPTGELSLATALNLALNGHPELRAASREVDATTHSLAQAGVLPNPEFSTLIEDLDKTYRTTTIQFNQPLELGGKRGARIAVAESDQQLASADLALKRNEITANTYVAFHDVLVAQEQVRLLQQSLTLAQRASDATVRQVKAGAIAPIDETKARVAESTIRLELARAQAEQENARQHLASLWGSTVPRFNQVQGVVDRLPSINAADLSRSLERAPQLLRLKAELAQRQAQVEVERRRGIPDLTLSLGAKRDEQLGTQSSHCRLFHAPARIRSQPRHGLRAALARSDKAGGRIPGGRTSNCKTTLNTAYRRFDLARREITTQQRELLDSAQQALDVTTKGFSLGKFGLLEVLDAQRTLLQARSQYLRALSEAYRAAGDIHRIARRCRAAAGVKHEQKTDNSSLSSSSRLPACCWAA
jgi:cobalt-zinc-cadmium efflux system outer membrane protein